MSENWVITAGHCCEEGTKADDFRIYAGVEDTERLNFSTFYRAHSFYPHPDYGSAHEISHDFCLIKTSEEMVLKRGFVDFACLPEGPGDNGRKRKCFTAGWGFDAIDGKPTGELNSIQGRIIEENVDTFI